MGATDLRGPDGQTILSVLSQSKRLTLLAYLTMSATGSFTRREKLLALFWPESDTHRARAALRKALSYLRKSLGNDVIVTRGDEQVGIAPSALECDAVRFDAAVDHGDLEEAWELYTGPFLDGVHVSGSAGADQWLEQQRGRLCRRAVAVATGLAESAEARGDLPAAVGWARDALALEPYREVSLRRLMELLTSSGDRQEAVRSYDDYATRLGADLEIEPSSEMRSFVRLLRTDHEPEAGLESDGKTRSPQSMDPVPTGGDPARGGRPAVPHLESASADTGSGSRAWRSAALVSGAIAFLLFVSTVAQAPGIGGRPSSRFDLILPESTPLVFVGEASLGVGQPALALSPDGRQLVYVGPAGVGTQLYSRSTRDGSVTVFSGTEGASAPFFSSDGAWVGFFAGQHLWRVSSDGEQAQPLHRVDASLGGSWAEDGRIAAVIHDGRPLAVIPPGGGEADILQPDGTLIAHPFWLPGSEWILLTCYDPKHLCAMSTAGELRHLTADGPPLRSAEGARLISGSSPRYVEPGYLVYTAPARNALLGVLFDPTSMTVRGEAEVVYEGVRREAFLGSAQASLSASGDLVLARGANADEGRFVWVGRNGEVESLDLPSRVYGLFHLSDDGRYLAAMAYPQVGERELWFMDLEAGGPGTRWTDDGTVGDLQLLAAAWLPRGEGLLAVAFGGGSSLILQIDPRRPSGGTVLWSGSGRAAPMSVGQDGRIVMRVGSPEGISLSLIEPGELTDLSLDPGKTAALIVPPFTGNTMTDLSPDGRWLVYHSQEEGAYQVYAVPTDPPGVPTRISNAPGEVPVWSPKGDGIYYRYGKRFYWVPFTVAGEKPFGEPRLFLEGDYLNVNGRDVAVSPDGSRLLLLQPGGKPTSSTLDVVLNFRARLEDLLGPA